MDKHERALPGYEKIDPPKPANFANTEHWTSEQWERDFKSTLFRLNTFLRIHDPFAILARTATRCLIEQSDLAEIDNRVDQVQVEITQILLLLNGKPASGNPISPRNFEKYWPLINRLLHAFSQKQPQNHKLSDAERYVTHRVRLQTLYYRNLFSREGCVEAVGAILSRIDTASFENLGFRLSGLFYAAVRISEIIENRLKLFANQIVNITKANNKQDIVRGISFFEQAYPLVKRTWKNRTHVFDDIESLRFAALQISELSHPWIYTISREALEKEFEPNIVKALYKISLKPGDLSEIDPEHIYLNNPIWQRPYIAKDDGSLFVALPQLIFSFPFAIAEYLMSGYPLLESAYAVARSTYLEKAVVKIIETAMPSAKVYQCTKWIDPDTGKIWENDVVALIGNFIFLFEAKSGQIKDAGRRGGILSLRKDFKSLFVEPGTQSGRLEKYLENTQENPCIISINGEKINLHLDRKKLVFSYSICIEHFTVLTNARYHLKSIGLVSENTPWAPVLSLGELQMIARFLDSEVSFVHYLTRRATLEQVLDFEGDEQDILSAYLTNGLWIDTEALEGQRVMFFASDAAVRRHKVPRVDRTIVDLPGVALSPLWKSIVQELYRDDKNRYRFDIINTILNQMPPALRDAEHRIRRFRRNIPQPEGDILIVKYAVGKKIFAIVAYMAKPYPDFSEWQETARNIAKMLLPKGGSVECAAFVFLRRSKTTFDAVSFYRCGENPNNHIDQ